MQRRWIQAFFQWPPVSRRDKRHRLEHKRFHLNIRKSISLFSISNCVSDSTLAQGAQSGCGVSPPWRSSKAPWIWSWAPCPGCSCLNRGPCQCKPFHDFMKFLNPLFFFSVRVKYILNRVSCFWTVLQRSFLACGPYMWKRICLCHGLSWNWDWEITGKIILFWSITQLFWLLCYFCVAGTVALLTV